jgi:predicted transposase YdaD
MTVLRELPWYQEILQKSLVKGEQKGKAEEERSLVLYQLTRRLGTLPTTVEEPVQALALPQLEALGEALLDFVQLSDLTDWLQGH